MNIVYNFFIASQPTSLIYGELLGINCTKIIYKKKEALSMYLRIGEGLYKLGGITSYKSSKAGKQEGREKKQKSFFTN